MLTVRRFLLLATIGLILAGAVYHESPWAGSSGASAAGSGPEMRLAVKEGGACDADTCRIPLGATFTLSVDIFTPPADYNQINSFVVFGPDLIYKPTDTARDEFVWPDCGPAALPVREQLEAVPNSVLHSCATRLLPPFPLVSYTGNFVDLSMTCSNAESSTLVELLQNGEDPAGDNGALYKLFDGSEVIPKVRDLTVVCGSGTPPPKTATPANSPTPDPGNAEMALTVKEGDADCEADTCTLELDAEFTLSIEIVTAPPDYILVNSFIVYGPELIYTPTETVRDEFIWTDCGAGALSVREQFTSVPNSVLHGCLTGLLPPLPVSNYTGNFIDLSMTCSSVGSTTEVELVPMSPPPYLGTSGALFKLSDGSEVIPKVRDLTVICGSGTPPPDTPTPTRTPRPPATLTPTPVPPTATPVLTGDANCDGTVDAVDASLVLQFEAGLVGALACGDRADVNGDGLINSLDAMLILRFTADLVQQLPAGKIR